MFQDYALFPNLSALAQRGLRDARRPAAERRGAARASCSTASGMAALADARPRDALRAASASGSRSPGRSRASPRALLLDEPLSALDARTRGRRPAGARAPCSRAADVPALLVTHDFEEAALLADRVAIVDGGRVRPVGHGGRARGVARARAFVADLTGAVVLSGTARGPEGGLTEVALDGGGAVASTDRADGPGGRDACTRGR